MVAKRNPPNLNALQLKTLTLLQALAQLPAFAQPGEEAGSVAISLPDPHGDHFHLGEAIIAARDATGLRNPAVWAALERKGLIRSMYPDMAVLTPLGLGYETGGETVLLVRRRSEVIVREDRTERAIFAREIQRRIGEPTLHGCLGAERSEERMRLGC